MLFNDAFTLQGDAVRDRLDRIEESDEPGRNLIDRDIDALIDSPKA